MKTKRSIEMEEPEESMKLSLSPCRTSQHTATNWGAWGVELQPRVLAQLIQPYVSKPQRIHLSQQGQLIDTGLYLLEILGVNRDFHSSDSFEMSSQIETVSAFVEGAPPGEVWSILCTNPSSLPTNILWKLADVIAGTNFHEYLSSSHISHH